MSLSSERHAEPQDVEVVGLGVVRVPLRTPTLPPATRTNAYIVRGASGWWVVDPAAADAGECEVLAAAMRDAELSDGAPIQGAILTHHHPDHIGGLGWWADTLGLEVVADHRTIVLVRGAVGRDDLDAAATLRWRAVDGDSEVDGLALLFTPGHAPGHLAIWTGGGHHKLEAGVLIAGDLVSGIGTIIVSPPRGDMAAYLRSLTRAAELRPSLMLPSHGPETRDAEGRLRAYIEHRLAREARVLEALRVDAWTSLDAITAHAYHDVPGVFRGFASRVVEAHLVKLMAEGLVRERGGEYARVQGAG